MTRGETRVAKLEARIGGTGLSDVFRLTDWQLAHLAGVSESASDEELAAVIAVGAEGGGDEQA